MMCVKRKFGNVGAARWPRKFGFYNLFFFHNYRLLLFSFTVQFPLDTHSQEMFTCTLFSDLCCLDLHKPSGNIQMFVNLLQRVISHY